jgi:hypothetical protein
MVTMSNLVNRPPEDPPSVSLEVLGLLHNYLQYMKGEVPEFDKALVETVQRQADNTWNNEDFSAAKAEANRRSLFQDVEIALNMAKEAYDKAVHARHAFEVSFETIAESGRGLRCAAVAAHLFVPHALAASFDGGLAAASDDR